MTKRNFQMCWPVVAVAYLFLATTSFAAEGGVKILSMKNKVDVVSAKGGVSPASEGMQLHEGDVVKTFANGISILQMSSGDMITVMQFSEFVIGKQYTDRNSSRRSFNIPKGKVYAKVSKLKKGDSFQISTPTAVAGVRGTLFSVSPGNIKCVEGAVTVSQGGKVHEVGEMQEVNLGSNGMTEPEAISNEGLKEVNDDMNTIKEAFGGMTFTKQAVESVEKMAVTRPGLKLGQPFSGSEAETSEDETDQIVLNGKGSKSGEVAGSGDENGDDSHDNGSRGNKNGHESDKSDGDKEKLDEDSGDSGAFGNSPLMDDRTILSIVTKNAGSETPEAGNKGN